VGGQFLLLILNMFGLSRVLCVVSVSYGVVVSSTS